MSSLAERTDQFDVLLDLASSTLADGSTVEAMRLARGVFAMEHYMDALERENAALRAVLHDVLETTGPIETDESIGAWSRAIDALAALAPATSKETP